MRGINSKGQFFILAAIIISSIVFSLATVYNSVDFSREQESFYDLSYEIKQESAMVIDYGVVNGEDELPDFAEVAAGYSESEGVELVFIYGNSSGVLVDNYGVDDGEDSFGNKISGGGKISSSVITMSVGSAEVGQTTSTAVKIFNKNHQVSVPVSGSGVVKISINDQDYKFSLMDNKQFFMIVKKSIGEEEYIDVK